VSDAEVRLSFAGSGDAPFADPHAHAILTSMGKGIFVRVTTETVVGGARTTAYWIVATDDPTTAEEIVRKAVALGCIVEATDTEVGPETVKRLGLAPGQAWHL
jgi:hypothetical protein